ncbi:MULTISPECIES: rod shape-determining protein RodA [Flavobacterium]|jgi:rod shape determining protein RodA|uniref:rod shape-determining protein RodA n=1 Tax=Flavobacterium TaxID=237 RepID=UPI0006F97BB8|nr:MULTISPECIES: rod shape-determining protein RodA [Flavobacterium]PZO29879.1 MAG: rod shape-determining protein RodA [Flavobacteriaceae bacterium]PZQ79148.1 MAG: rod shape-determining protein RodA [Flavobacterium johnsoniae]KQS46580.1 rod shape-determining protein RodA [Flavobacterium sp. Leaf359]OJX50934.1 MAG: rod shape-determining protein RodA [Flavobacterium sp. 38-13]THD33308.1 MAG: rod shape-determining protein RodA [Flavobacterium johnsoniae]
MKNQSVTSNIDWITILLFILLVIMGWLNIYSASLPLEQTSIFDISQIYGKQILFICLTVPLVLVVLTVDAKIYEKYAFVFYIAGLISLLGLFVFGKTIKGQTNWYSIGGFTLQPSEFVKTSTALLLAKYLSDVQVNLKNFNDQLKAFAIMGVPLLLILVHDTGTAMIFVALVFVLYREGLPAWYLWTGFLAVLLFFMSLLIEPHFVLLIALVVILIQFLLSKRINRNPLASAIIFVLIAGFTYSVDFVYDNVLEAHQKDRINVLFGQNVDLKNEGYNLNQSMIAIGSGGWFGKGFLEGTQTKGGFVPEQHTDYIFTTVGEEWGFVGAVIVIALFVALFLRIIYLAENQKTKFSRVYGYCVATFLFAHFFVNITMLIRLFPTIGVPLPFFSYGGSSLFAFSILLFIFIKMDANKVNEW